MRKSTERELTAEELVQWCRETLPEDTRAFEVLMAQYKQRVFSIAYRMLGHREEAEDQAQEVFFKVYRGILKLEDPATLPAWISRITVNTCLDALERARRHPQTMPFGTTPLDAQEEREYADERMVTPEEAMLQDELRRCVEATLAAIEPRERAVIILRDVEDRPYQEIAQALKLGLSAAKMRVHRARLAFQRTLERICPESWRQSLQQNPFTSRAVK